jgi:hypothetical protein
MQSEDDNRHKVIEVLAQANPDLIVRWLLLKSFRCRFWKLERSTVPAA